MKVEGLEFTYLIQPANKYTFTMPDLKRWVEEHCVGKVLNLFAGKIKLNVDEVRNDIDPEMPADYHMDAEIFCKMAIEKRWKFDTVILDPPYSLRKSMEKYGGRYMSSYQKIKELIPEILNDGGTVITLGYNTFGLERTAGFKKVAICIVNHCSLANDTLVLVERKVKDSPKAAQRKRADTLKRWFE